MDVFLSSTKPVKVLLKNGSIITGIPLEDKPEDVLEEIWVESQEAGNLWVQDGKLTWQIEAASIEAVAQW